MSGPVVAFCMQGLGHLQCMLPVIDELRQRGREVHVWTAPELRSSVERAGATFVDVFAKYPLQAADASSIPVPSRNVTFAGVYADAIAADLAELAPSAILHDPFAVIAPVLAKKLALPHVNVLPHHAMLPSQALAALRRDARVRTSPECLAAVRRLREVHGMPRANPFSYVEALSPYLNLYCEPREFLAGVDHAELEPLAFFGALAPDLRQREALPSFERKGRTRIYVSFGTVIWWYFEAAALAALAAIAAESARLDVEVVVSLAGHRLAASERSRLERENVRVVDDVDQWQVLREADVFVTHHGINSTHEAIYHQVPMLSYPFFGDQPALAQRCQDLGLALPLAAALGAIEPGALRAALARLERERSAFTERLAEARAWELRTIAARPAIVDRILDIVGGRI